ncbi:hypothetical protein [Desulfosporosinus fructosivorans]
MLKFVLLYLLVLAIILAFNYGAHAKERLINELRNKEDNSAKPEKSLGLVDECSYSSSVTHGMV